MIRVTSTSKHNSPEDNQRFRIQWMITNGRYVAGDIPPNKALIAQMTKEIEEEERILQEILAANKKP